MFVQCLFSAIERFIRIHNSIRMRIRTEETEEKFADAVSQTFTQPSAGGRSPPLASNARGGGRGTKKNIFRKISSTVQKLEGGTDRPTDRPTDNERCRDWLFQSESKNGSIWTHNTSIYLGVHNFGSFAALGPRFCTLILKGPFYLPYKPRN